ncbi:hypothetical protein ACWEPM_23185 [Streptomyces sp. NPDC004244]
MTWYQQPAVPASPQDIASKRIRRGSGIALVLFLPVLFLAKVALLATPRGGECLMYGGCAPFPAAPFLASACAALVAFGVVAAARPALGRAALGVQLLLEAAAVCMVLAYP